MLFELIILLVLLASMLGNTITRSAQSSEFEKRSRHSARGFGALRSIEVLIFRLLCVFSSELGWLRRIGSQIAFADEPPRGGQLAGQFASTGRLSECFALLSGRSFVWLTNQPFQMVRRFV